MNSSSANTANCNNIIPISDKVAHGLTSVNKPTRTAAQQQHCFRYRGRTWRLFKRSKSPNWQLQFWRAGQRFPHSLGTTSKEHAETEAKLKIDLWMDNRESDLRRSMIRPGDKQFDPIFKIVAAVPNLPIIANQKTRDSYVWSLCWVIKFALGVQDDATVMNTSCGELNKATTRAFFDKMIAHAATLESQADKNRWFRNAQTFYDNARSLFAPRPLEAMRETFKLQLPDLTVFRDGKKLWGVRVGSASDFERPSDDVILQTLKDWEILADLETPVALKRKNCNHTIIPLDRRNMFIAAGLAFSCGLRKAEIRKAKWSWFQREQDHPMLKANVNVKNKTGVIKVRPVDPFWSTMNQMIDANGWRGGPDDYCLEERSREKVLGKPECVFSGGHCDRTYWPFWLIGYWLRGLGWTTQKTNHALRDFSASTITTKYGLEAASRWCRHGQLATTQAHYNRFVSDEAMCNRELLDWFHWA
jgi:integrase